MCSCIDWRSTSRASACRTAGSRRVGCLDFMLARSPSTSFHGSVFCICIISMLPAGVISTLPLPPASRRLDLVLDLHVPRVVEFARLQHGASGRDGVAAALHL